jgi:hypothetical protein
MTKRHRSRINGHARPIRTQRDYREASAVARRLSARADRDSAAELRLQSLLRELDQFDDTEEEASADLTDENTPGPRRRWSDDPSDD